MMSGRSLLAVALAIALGSCETVPDGGAAGNGAQIDLPDAQASPLDRASVPNGSRSSSPSVHAESTLGELSPISDSFDSSVEINEPELVRGTGVLARRPTRSRTEVDFISDGDITLNFANAEIREVVDAVLGQALGLSYIIDPRVQGEVTARTSRPIPRQSVIPALENILALNGAALTLDNGVYKVVTLQQAATGLTGPTLTTRPEESAQGFSVNVIPVRYASAQALSEVLRPFIGPGRVFRVDASRNLIIFAGTGPEARDLIDMISVFDVDWMSGMSFALFPVQVADAKSIVADLDTIFLQGGQTPLAGLVRFVPIERLNAVLVISPQAAYLDQVETWIDRLDRGGEGSGRRIFVYHVQNGRSADLAEVLGRIFDIGGSDKKAPGDGLAPGLLPATLSSAPVAQDQQPPAQEGEAPPEAVASDGARVSDKTGISEITDGGNIRVIADERNNALVILATAAEYRMIEATLKRLDLTPLQVLIEVTIAEVTLNDTLKYGLQWFFQQGDNTAVFSTLADGAVSSAFPGFSYVFSPSDARVVLNALTEITDVQVVSSPQLMVLDNQSARLQVGDQVPIATQSAVSVSDSNAPVVNSIEFRDTGVILAVTPRVNAGGLVTLEVRQEVSDVVATTTSQLNSPTIQQRSIESTVAVQSGDTIALGGLIQDRSQEAQSGVPLLSEIPILGNLFKTTSEAQRRTELLVLITPRVVRDRGEAKDVTEELRRRLSGIEPLEMKIKAPK
jgi:general secretion pathway protein D